MVNLINLYYRFKTINFLPPDFYFFFLDTPSNRKLLSMLLVNKGLKVQSCSSGEETLDLVCNKKKEFDIVFMDNTMPGLVI